MTKTGQFLDFTCLNWHWGVINQFDTTPNLYLLVVGKLRYQYHQRLVTEACTLYWKYLHHQESALCASFCLVFPVKKKNQPECQYHSNVQNFHLPICDRKNIWRGEKSVNL